MRIDFPSLVREEFAILIEERRLREVRVTDDPIYKKIVFTNDDHVVYFYVDAREGYVDARYGAASTIDEAGKLRSPGAVAAASYGSVSVLLEQDGVRLPMGIDALYREGRLAEAIGALVDAIARHTAEVFAAPPPRKNIDSSP